MYYPYLRGKREELLALQELIQSNLLSKQIIPVIEPTSLSPTLLNCLKQFANHQREVYFIRNPKVGSFIDDMNKNDVDDDLDDKEKKKSERDSGYRQQVQELLESKFVHPALLFCEDISEWLYEIENNEERNDYAVMFCGDEDDIDSVICDTKNICFEAPVWFVQELSYRNDFDNDLVHIKDRFNRQAKNSDYSLKPDELFSRDHLSFLKNSYNGFSDYSVIGNKFDESGFTPYAIAIHIVYLDNEKNTLRIRHFVSDSNASNRNPARKFYEASKKLKEWVQKNNIPNTLGIRMLLEKYDHESYPGLGSLKRFSIMNHFEVIGKYLDNDAML